MRYVLHLLLLGLHLTFTTKQILKWGGLAALSLGLVVIYMVYDPAMAGFFPACPFHSLTGLECPGCGSQRAVHHLLNLELGAAFKQNQLLVVSLPYVLLGFVFDRILKPSVVVLKWRKILFGKRAILFVFSVVILFWVSRNIF